MVFVRLNTDPPWLDQVRISTNSFTIEDVSADEQGVIDGIENALKRFGIEDFGNTYGADGDSTSRGQLDGIIAFMR